MSRVSFADGTKPGSVDTPTKSNRVSSPHTNQQFDLNLHRGELRYKMHRKIIVLEHKTFMDKFTDRHPLRWRPKNYLADVPTPTTETQMYDTLPAALNKSGLCSGYTFVATPHKTDDADPTKQAVDCGMYQTGFAPQPVDGTYPCVDWSRMELSIECKADCTAQDPFDANATDDQPTAEKRKRALGQILSYAELIFHYQQRTWHFMILFLGDFARIVRFDRSSIFATTKFNYKTETNKLNEFLWRYSHQGITKRGHDPTATRVERGGKLWDIMMKKKGSGLDADDYVQKLFDDSLDEAWPWWQLEVPVSPHPGKPRTRLHCAPRRFLVGKPHFLAPGVTGRGTRGYVALPLDVSGKPSGSFVYLKDAWRVDHKGIEKEGDILHELNQAKVDFVPTLVCHGDLSGPEQTINWVSLWKEYYPKADESECPLKKHQHYRAVVQEVGKPLTEFGPGSDDLVLVIVCILRAHAAAYSLGIIHRDISAGNTLLWKDRDGEWYGLLNDWELSQRHNVDYGENRQPDRTGTWQFMSAHALNSETRRIILPDELESIFHVLLYVAVRFLPHNLRDGDVGQFLYDYFDGYSPHSTGIRCGSLKLSAMETGVISLKRYNGDQDPNNKNLRFGFDPSQPSLLPLPPSATIGRQVTPQPPASPAAVPASPAVHSPRSHSPMPDASSARSSDMTAPSYNQPISANDPPSPSVPPQANSTCLKRTHPFNAIVDQLLEWFQAYYALCDLAPDTPQQDPASKQAGIDPSTSARYQKLCKLKATALKSSLKSVTASQAVSQPSMKTGGTATTRIKELQALAGNLLSHQPFDDLLMKSLKQQRWPGNDKGEDKKPKGGIVVPKDQAPAVSGTHTSARKRSLEETEAQKERKRSRTS